MPCYWLLSDFFLVHSSNRAEGKTLALNILCSHSPFIPLICFLTRATSFKRTKHYPLHSCPCSLSRTLRLTHRFNEQSQYSVRRTLWACKFAFICICFDYSASLPLACRSFHPYPACHVNLIPTSVGTVSHLWTEEGKEGKEMEFSYLTWGWFNTKHDKLSMHSAQCTAVWTQPYTYVYTLHTNVVNIENSC